MIAELLFFLVLHWLVHSLGCWYHSAVDIERGCMIYCNWYGCPSEDGRHRILYVEKNMGLCLSSNLAICKHCHIWHAWELSWICFSLWWREHLVIRWIPWLESRSKYHGDKTMWKFLVINLDVQDISFDKYHIAPYLSVSDVCPFQNVLDYDTFQDLENNSAHQSE